jgi:thermostable 8-oxoguanine DNA glycosylase
MAPGLHRTELNRLIRLYHLEQYLFGEVSPRFSKEQTLASFDFFAIIAWKSNRSKTKVKDGLAAAGKSVSEIMKEVSQAPSPEEKVKILLNIQWIGLPIASAVLTVCYPKEFTILDYRAWETLKEAGVKGLPPHYPQNATSYVQYCQVCIALAEEARLSLRDLDRALWAKSWEKDLRSIGCTQNITK